LEVKIIDFGLAKGQHAQRITRAGIVPGTIRFFSPEQAAGEDATEQSDQYSIGLCLYFCLTGHEPYDQLGTNPMDLITAINNGQFPRPRTYRDLPESLEAIILRAMHREPAQRFPSVRDLGRALWPFAGAAHQALWRTEYGRDAEPVPAQAGASDDGPAQVAPEGAGATSWWNRFRRRR
jgi:serine/threonine protein kinase